MSPVATIASYAATETRIRELARAALAEGRVDYVIGWKYAYNRSEVVPAFARSVEEVDQLVWNPLAHHNLTAFLKRNMPDPANARIGVCVKGCDSRTLVALLQENLLDRERLYIIGVPCSGIVDRRVIEKAFADEVVDIEFDGDVVRATSRRGETKELSRADMLLDGCKACHVPNPRVADELAGEPLPEPEGEPVWAGIEEFEALTPAERDAKLEEIFATCIRCGACINACPVCWCWDQCAAKARRPQLVSQKVTAKENLLFQMVHMFHLTGRCPSCGACDRACPVEIPLYLLHRKMNKELYEMLGFQAGMNLDEKPVFQTFKLEDAFGDYERRRAMNFLPEDKLQAFLGYLAEEARVFTPARDERGQTVFQRWAPGTEPELEVLLAKQAPKDLIFRQHETCMTFDYEMQGDSYQEPLPPGSVEEAGAAPPPVAKETLVVDPTVDAPAQVIFGLRPCDARGFAQMDRVFSGYGGFYFDPYYNAKREATTLLAVTCQAPRSTCFCRAIGGSPSGTEAVDALFTTVAGGFTIEPLTEKGQRVMAFSGIRAATAAEEQQASALKTKAEAEVDIPFELEGLREKLRENFESFDWHELAMRCVSCGTCTYVCPNCYCFNITDEIVEGKGERLRSWDNCMNPTYTLETSGHNPRDPKANRFRNRFSHKFWYYPEKYDSLLCSGCGRCISGCPTKIDIREVLRVLGGQELRGADREAVGIGVSSGAGAPTGRAGEEA